MQNADLTEKSGTLENRKNLFSCIKVGKKILTLNKFYHYKTPIFLGDVDIEEVLVSTKFLLAKKNY